MDAETAEQVRQARHVADPATDPRGVVEHTALRHAPDVLEDVLEALAHALGGLAVEDLGEPDVGKRVDHDEVVHPDEAPLDAAVGFAEVDLRLAGIPDKVQVLASGVGIDLVFDSVNEVADGRVADLRPALLAQPLVNPRDGVPLLAVGVLVFLEPLPNDGFVGIELRRPLLPHLHRGREVFHPEIFSNRGFRDAHCPRDRGDALSLPMQASDSADSFHVDHFPSTFFPALSKQLERGYAYVCSRHDPAKSEKSEAKAFSGIPKKDSWDNP